MIIITGASSGIGQFLKEYFEKTNIVYGAKNSSTCNSDLVTVDICDFEAVQRWINMLPIKSDSKIVLINCAGINYNSFAHKADPNQWKRVIETNLVGSFNVIHALLPKMRELNWGRIVNFSSIVAQKGVLGTSAYAASKSGLWGLTKAISSENAAKGVTINNINLGYCDIGMGITQISKEQKESLLLDIPAKRFGNPEEIARTVEYLISTEFINGTSIDLNGGQL